jgi:pimeloyl-ACP methyl ester carboxylesterase
VRALVLIDTQAGADTAEANEAILEKVRRWQNDGLSPEIADETERLLLGVGWPGAATWRSKWAAMSSTNLTQCFQTLVNRDDILDRMSAITVPALVIHGSGDRAITLDKAELLASEMPNAKLVVIEGAAHAPNLTHPDAVNAAIMTFLDGIPS